MRFCHPFSLTVNSRDGEQALLFLARIDFKSSAQRDQPRVIVFSPRTIFLHQIARPTRCPRNLTEFAFAPNFSKPDLEVL
jgi:hypothetical protein